MKHKQVQSLEELKKNQFKIINSNNKHNDNLSKLDLLALWITNHVGSMKFFFIIFIWTFLWLSWNTLAPISLRFDPYPAFVLWLFISNMIQIFLMPLIMVGQNLQSKHSEIRAEEDYKVNMKSESEIETVLKHLENQNEIILELLRKVEKLESK